MKKIFVAFTLSVAVVAIAAAQQRGAGPGRANQPPWSARQPGRIHITWQDENTLKMEFDAGTQTKLIRFAPAASAAPAGPRTWQGTSVGEWARPGRNAVADARVSEAVQQGAVPGGGGGGLRGAPPRSASMFEGGSLKVTTTNFRE